MNNQNAYALSRFVSPFLLILLFIYLSFILVNYNLVRNNNKHTKQILIGELVGLVILMVLIFILFLQF